jgi:hypothetical protein
VDSTIPVGSWPVTELLVKDVADGWVILGAWRVCADDVPDRGGERGAQASCRGPGGAGRAEPLSTRAVCACVWGAEQGGGDCLCMRYGAMSEREPKAGRYPSRGGSH